MSCSLSSVFDNFRYIFFQINNNSLSSVLKARLGRLRTYRLLLKCSFLLLEPIFFSLNLLFRLLDRLDDLATIRVVGHLGLPDSRSGLIQIIDEHPTVFVVPLSVSGRRVRVPINGSFEVLPDPRKSLRVQWLTQVQNCL